MNLYYILGVVHLILFIIALVEIITSKRDIGEKLLWLLIVLLLPLIGVILYFLIGRK